MDVRLKVFLTHAALRSRVALDLSEPVGPAPEGPDGGLFGDDHIGRVIRSSPDRDQVFDELARLAADQEPSRLTLLN